MALPKPEYDTEIIPNADSWNATERRMKKIVATPEEIQRYKFDPLSARNNVHAGIPCDDYTE